jgi:hypothetical protein
MEFLSVMFVSCTVFVLSGRGLCDGPIPRPEESYRLWCVFECDHVKIKILYTYCEQVGRRGKDYEMKPINSSLLTITLYSLVITTLVYNDTKHPVPFMTL